jgi:hypothetical protein
MLAADAPQRDTKRTQEHRKDTKLWSLTVNCGKRRIPCFAWSERTNGADVDFCTRASVGSIPATSTKLQGAEQGFCSIQVASRHENNTTALLAILETLQRAMRTTSWCSRRWREERDTKGRLGPRPSQTTGMGPST